MQSAVSSGELDPRHIRWEPKTHTNGAEFTCSHGRLAELLHAHLPASSTSALIATGEDQRVDAVEERLAVLTGWGRETNKQRTQL